MLYPAELRGLFYSSTLLPYIALLPNTFNETSGSRLSLGHFSRGGVCLAREVDGSILSVPDLADKNPVKPDKVLDDSASCFRVY